ncbi:diguanylate cyclase domain-containing protein [Azotosporobacter soli]|uniref:diguanylate cyclase domain-containing protein n=1 Tax=Azotosporobacter soli TaxID=3055040 RepID=UPI0031FF2098
MDMCLNSLLESLLGKIDGGIILLDAELKICHWNAWLERMSGVAGETARRKMLAEVWPSFGERFYLQALQNALLKGQSRFWAGQLHGDLCSSLAATSEEKVYNIRIEPLSHCEAQFILLQVSDVTLQTKRIAQLQYGIRKLAADYEEDKLLNARRNGFFDPLTGLHSRALLEERIDYVLAQAARGEQKVGLLCLKLPDFQMLTQEKGAIFMERILREAARRLECCVRKSDTLARWDEDEFVLLLSHIKRSADAGVVAENILRAFKPVWRLEKERLKIKAALGIRIFPDQAEAAQELLDKARAEMLADTRQYEVVE